MSLHFWSKEDGEAALKQLEDEFQTIQFRCSFNIAKPEEEVAQTDIVEVEEVPADVATNVSKPAYIEIKNISSNNPTEPEAAEVIRV